VIIPSTNTVVEHDYNKVAPAGITFHAGRMYVARPQIDSDAGFEDLVAQLNDAIEIAIRDVLTCEPDHMVMGMSVATFWGGIDGNRQFEERMRALAGLPISTGATACREALELIGLDAIAVLSPYQPVADAHVTRFFEETGFSVKAFKGLRCPTATAIAQVTESAVIDALRELNKPGVDAIVQVGTDLSMLRLADEAERWLEKPVIAINAATLWHALRKNAFSDRFTGFGSLLRDF